MSQTKTQTINLPNKVIDSDWKDDIDYEAYEDEKTYVSPNKVNRATINRIKNSPIKLAIKDMVDWRKIIDQVAA